MLTREQALTAKVFHYEPACTPKRTERYRRNGRTQTWKTRPNEWRIPVKHGIHRFSQIWHWNADLYHTAEDCPHGHK